MAAQLERTHDLDPQCLIALHKLLANGCDSPLYNPKTPFSEIQNTLDYVRSGL